MSWYVFVCKQPKTKGRVAKMKRADWEDLRILATVSRSRTLRHAAEKLGVSPATLSRRLDALEATQGEKLIDRKAQGCQPTEAGQHIVALVAQMEEIAAEIDRVRESGGVQGVVRVNADEWVTHYLTMGLAPLRARHPDLAVEMVTTHRPLSLGRRETDIALRAQRPEHGDLVSRKLGQMSFGLYCSRRYHDANAVAIAAQDWARLSFVGFDEARAGFAAETWLAGLAGVPATGLRCSYALGIFDGVVFDCGLGVLANFITKGRTDLVAVLPHIPELDQEIWLAMHRSLRGSGRVRAVWDHLGSLF